MGDDVNDFITFINTVAFMYLVTFVFFNLPMIIFYLVAVVIITLRLVSIPIRSKKADIGAKEFLTNELHQIQYEFFPETL